jgi:hypothetical protein
VDSVVAALMERGALQPAVLKIGVVALVVVKLKAIVTLYVEGPVGFLEI